LWSAKLSKNISTYLFASFINSAFPYPGCITVYLNFLEKIFAFNCQAGRGRLG
jgi:hypothetical protein